MANTIVSLFDEPNIAQTVMQDFIKEGFERGDVNILTGKDSNLSSALTAANVPQESAKFYAEGVRRGGSLLTVRVEDEKVDRAMEILNRYEVVDINERAEQYRSSGFTDFNIDRDSTRREGETALPVIEEQIQVGKRQVQGGGVRVYSRIVETPVQETVQLREEHVNVERRPVDRAVSAADMDAFREGTIEMTETSEQAVVSKQARVVEEVVVNKNVSERAETVSDTVRRTDVEVEDIGSERVRSATTSSQQTNPKSGRQGS